jgi:hypothetical protein
MSTMKSMIAELRSLLAEADAVEETESAEMDEVTKYYPMAHKNSLGPGPKGRKFGGGNIEKGEVWSCKCPGGKCVCNRKSKSSGKMLKKTWTVNKERKAKYDKMYKDWRAKKERTGKYAKTDADVRKAAPPVSPHIGAKD